MTWYNPATWGKTKELAKELNVNLDEMNMDDTPPDDPNEPWVFIKGMVHDPVDGVKIELDWNAGFVQYLRDGGIDGSSDETVVQKYLAMLHRQMLDQYNEEGGSGFE